MRICISKAGFSSRIESVSPKNLKFAYGWDGGSSVFVLLAHPF